MRHGEALPAENERFTIVAVGVCLVLALIAFGVATIT
jgi:hypothetical protein